MAGRPKHFSDEELIDRATEVFWKKGYNSASAKDLMEAMDIGQGSLYSSFKGGKKELYQKSLLRFLGESVKQFYEQLDKSENPKQFIKDFFYNVPNRSMQERKNGCYLGNTIVELSNLDEETNTLSINLLKKLEKAFEKALIKAKKLGQLDEQKDPKILAAYLINLWNGINVTQRMHPNKKQILEILNLSLQILD